MIGQGSMFGCGWWDMAVEVANRRAFLTGFRHSVRWDSGCGVWRVTLAYPRSRR